MFASYSAGFEAGVGSGPSANVRICAGTCDPPSGGTPVLNEAQDANEFFSKSFKSITSKVLIERFTPLATSTSNISLANLTWIMIKRLRSYTCLKSRIPT